MTTNTNKRLIRQLVFSMYSTLRLTGSRIIESAAYYNQIFPIPLYPNKIRRLIETFGNVITFTFAQSDHSKRRTLYL